MPPRRDTFLMANDHCKLMLNEYPSLFEMNYCSRHDSNRDLLLIQSELTLLEVQEFYLILLTTEGRTSICEQIELIKFLFSVVKNSSFKYYHLCNYKGVSKIVIWNIVVIRINFK